jgi:hypothetical protein
MSDRATTAIAEPLRADVRCAIAPEVRFYRPEEGLMFLFPSYFYHRTVPFESEQLRVSIAFDIRIPRSVDNDP